MVAEVAQQGADPRLVDRVERPGVPRRPEQQVGRRQDDDRAEQADDDAHPERGGDVTVSANPTRPTSPSIESSTWTPADPSPGRCRTAARARCRGPDHDPAEQEAGSAAGEVARHPAGRELVPDPERSTVTAVISTNPMASSQDPPAGQRQHPAQLGQDQPPDDQQPPGRPQSAAERHRHHHQQRGVDEARHDRDGQQRDDVPRSGK